MANTVIAVDTYPGVRSEDYALSGEEITFIIERNLTDDRVFGVMSHYNLDEFFIAEKLEDIKKRLDKQKGGIILIVGVGASLVYGYQHQRYT